MMRPNRCGSSSSGSRMARASSVDRLMVPKMVVSAWFSAAATTSLDDGAGCALRWKYHWDTVAPVVARCTPAMTDRVQRYIRTK